MEVGKKLVERGTVCTFLRTMTHIVQQNEEAWWKGINLREYIEGCNLWEAFTVITSLSMTRSMDRLPQEFKDLVMATVSFLPFERDDDTAQMRERIERIRELARKCAKKLSAADIILIGRLTVCFPELLDLLPTVAFLLLRFKKPNHFYVGSIDMNTGIFAQPTKKYKGVISYSDLFSFGIMYKPELTSKVDAARMYEVAKLLVPEGSVAEGLKNHEAAVGLSSFYFFQAREFLYSGCESFEQMFNSLQNHLKTVGRCGGRLVQYQDVDFTKRQRLFTDVVALHPSGDWLHIKEVDFDGDYVFQITYNIDDVEDFLVVPICEHLRGGDWWNDCDRKAVRYLISVTQAAKDAEDIEWKFYKPQSWNAAKAGGQLEDRAKRYYRRMTEHDTVIGTTTRKMPVGYVRSEEKTREMKARGLNLPENVTLVSEHVRHYKNTK